MDYAVDTVGGAIDAIRKIGENDIEVDINRFDKEVADHVKAEIIEKSITDLTTIYDGLMSKICGSADKVPQEICDATKMIYDEVRNKGGDDDSARRIAAGTITLRFLNGFIPTPQTTPNGELGGEYSGSGQKRAGTIIGACPKPVKHDFV